MVLAVAWQQTFWILAQDYGAPHPLGAFWRGLADTTGLGLGQDLSLSNPFRKALTAYQHATGIEGGYGFFAPNVPSSYKLVFELHYADGRVEYDLPHVSNAASGLRLTSLLDRIGRSQYEPLRELMLKMLAYAMWQEHPEATDIRAVFGYVDVPTIAELRAGTKETYHFLYAYDFSFTPPPQQLPRSP